MVTSPIGQEVMSMCTKRAYKSIGAAKKAHRNASYRIRVYRCSECQQFHVTNQDKRERHAHDEDFETVTEHHLGARLPR